MNSKEKELIKNALIAISLRDEAAITKRLENEPTPTEEFYKELDEKVKKKIRENEKHVSLKKTITILIAAALLISVFSITAFAGERIKDFWVEIFDTFSKLNPDKNEKIPLTSCNVDISYIPDNFTKVKEKVDNISGIYEWQSNDNIILLCFESPTSGTFILDTENSNYITIPFENFVVHRTEKHGQINATWTDGKLVYSLACTGVEWEEMVKIIEGITLTESE